MKNRAVVLVTAIGSVAGEYIISRLKELGYETVGCDIYEKYWLAYADLPDSFYRVRPATEETAYVNQLIKICRDEKVDFIFPLTDVEVDVLDRHRKMFENVGIKICISPPGVIPLVRNKYLLAKKVESECTLTKSIPVSYLKDFVNKIQGWENHTDKYIVKLVDGRSSQGLYCFSSRDEVEFFAKKNERQNYIVQPFIKGNRIVADVVRQPESGTVVVASRKELLSTTNGCGTSVYVFEDPILKSICIELAENLGIIGCVNFEFLQDMKGSYHLLECNPRFSAGAEFSAMAGCDLVAFHIKCFKNETFDEFKLLHPMYIARKWTEVITNIE